MDYVELFYTLLALRDDPANQMLSPSQLTALVRPILKEHGIKTYTGYHTLCDDEDILISGMFVPTYEARGEVSVSVTLLFRPGVRCVNLRTADWTYSAADICATIGHEFKHREQTRNRDFFEGFMFSGDGSRSQTYYGDPDEIEAFGFGVALNRALRFQNGDAILPVPEDATYEKYVSIFDEDHYIVKLLHRNINKFFKQLTKPGGLNVKYRHKRRRV